MAFRYSHTYQIGGSIDTLEAFQLMVKALFNECLEPRRGFDVDGKHVHYNASAEDISKYLIQCSKNQCTADFDNHQASGDADNLETICITEGLSFYGSCEQYEEGMSNNWTYDALTETKREWDSGSEGRVSITDLEEALKANDHLTSIRALISKSEADTWQQVPPIFITDDVMKKLANPDEKVFRLDIDIHATAYIRAESKESALQKAKDQLSNDEMDYDWFSDLRLDDPNLPEVSISPAMTVEDIGENHTVIDVEEAE